MANNFSVIQTGGKQYKVASGEKLRVEKLDAKDGAIVFDKVLLRSVDGNVEIGTPYVSGAKVEAKVLGNIRGDKKIVFRYHSKTRQRKKKGHRQEHTEVVIQ
jgi:large subunit ribosomal protein L21